MLSIYRVLSFYLKKTFIFLSYNVDLRRRILIILTFSIASNQAHSQTTCISCLTCTVFKLAIFGCSLFVTILEIIEFTCIILFLVLDMQVFFKKLNALNHWRNRS